MTNRGKLNLCIWKGENDKAAGHRVLFSLLSFLKVNETASWRQVVLTSTRQTQQGRSVDLIIEVWRWRNIRNKKSWGLVGRIIRRTFPGRSRFVSVKLHKWRNWTLIGHKEGCFSKLKQLDNINKHSKSRNVWNVSNWHWTYWILIIKPPSVLNSQVGYNHGSSGKWLEKRHQSVLLHGVASGLFFFPFRRPCWHTGHLRRASVSHLFLPRHVPGSRLKPTCRRSETHNRWRSDFFPVHSFLSLSLSLSGFLALSAGVKENHVISVIDNHQSQTPCRQIGQQQWSKQASSVSSVFPEDVLQVVLARLCLWVDSQNGGRNWCFGWNSQDKYGAKVSVLDGNSI